MHRQGLAIHTLGAGATMDETHSVAVALVVVLVLWSKKSSQKDVPSQSSSSKMQRAEDVSPRRHSRPYVPSRARAGTAAAASAGVAIMDGTSVRSARKGSIEYMMILW
jgi:hypothetical protein